MNYIEIENKRPDIYNISETVYEFKSPIFTNIEHLMTSRTYSMKLPITKHNLNIFEWCNHPKSKTTAGHRELKFSEYRQNKLFMSGVAYVDSIDNNDINLTVVGGICPPMGLLQNLKLREIKLPTNTPLPTSILWDDNKKLIPASSTNQVGYVFADFGSIGTEMEKLMPPSVNFAYILQAMQYYINNYETEGEKIYADFEISVPQNIKAQLNTIWIPLLDNNNQQNNKDNTESPKYISNLTNGKMIKGAADSPAFMLFDMQSSDITQNIVVKAGNKGTVLAATSDAICGFRGTICLKCDIDSKYNPPKEMLVSLIKFSSRVDYYKGVEQAIIFPIEKNNEDNDGSYICRIVLPNMQTNSAQQGESLILGFQYRNENESKFNNELSEWTVLDSYNGVRTMLTAFVKHNKVQYGEQYPIIPNLPDITAKDFFECLTNMFCVYFSASQTNINQLEMRNVSDIISKEAQNQENIMKWHDKELCNSREVSFAFGDYAQKNSFVYSEDPTEKLIENDTDTINEIVTMQGVLPQQKNKFTSPFAASRNTKTAQGSYALIPLFKTDMQNENEKPTRQNIKYRIGRESLFMQNGISCKSLVFDESLHFGGSTGLIHTYHKDLSNMLRNVFVLKTSFSLNKSDILNFDINKTIQLDGVRFLILNISFMSDGVVDLQACRI